MGRSVVSSACGRCVALATVYSWEGVAPHAKETRTIRVPFDAGASGNGVAEGEAVGQRAVA